MDIGATLATVVGSGEVAPVLDAMEFSVGVLTQNQTVTRTLDVNDKLMASLCQVLE